MKALVIGDIILDKYVDCTAVKISEEAPVLVGKVKDYFYYLGGAGNLAINLKNLGLDVDIITSKNYDSAGKIVDDLLAQAGINQIKVDGGCPPTTVKTRYMIHNHQIVRIDEENTDDKIYSLNGIDFNSYDAILISDYAKGMINKKWMLNWLDSNTLLIINGKPKNIELYQGCDYLVMNEKEVKHIMLEQHDVLLPSDICSKYGILKLVMTKGDKGISIYNSKEEIAFMPAEKIEVNSIVGAGDCTTAAVTYGLLNNFESDRAIIAFANKIAGIKCTLPYTQPIKLSDIPNLGE